MFGPIMLAISRRSLATAFLALFLGTSCMDVVTAQVPDQRRAKRRTFVEGLLRGLLESQLEQAEQPGPRQAYPQPRVQPVPATRVRSSTGTGDTRSG